MRVLVIIFGGASVILLAIAGLLYFKEQSFLNSSEEATGKIAAIEVSTDTDGTSDCPVIEFTTKSGQLVRFTGDICSSPPNFNIGDTEDVIFDPQNPKNVQVKGLFSEYLGSFILSAVGLPFLAIGIWGLFKDKQGA